MAISSDRWVNTMRGPIHQNSRLDVYEMSDFSTLSAHHGLTNLY